MGEGMQKTVFDVLDKHTPRSRHFVLAFSGGVDSCVLLHLLSQYLQQHGGVTAKAVYVHHGLNAHADEWGNLCQQWANALGIECVIERVVLSLDEGESVEAEARTQRYDALSRHVGQGDVLLTAQHANDQLETFLLALKRGSGPAGLSSMPERLPFGDGVLVRPLLRVSRESVVQYAKAQGLSWVEDESNQDTRYDRNFLRHQVVAVLAERWPSIYKAVARSAQLCGEQESLLSELLQETLSARLHQDGSLNIEASDSLQKAFALIRLWLKGQNVAMLSQAQIQSVWQNLVLAQDDANPKLALKQGEIRRFQSRLYWVKPPVDCCEWAVEWNTKEALNLPHALGELTLVQGEGSALNLRFPKKDEVVSVRFNPTGLMAKPIGRVGSRSMKKLYQEYGVPSWRRRSTPLIFYGDQLAAVAGLFVVSGFEGEDLALHWHQNEKGR